MSVACVDERQGEEKLREAVYSGKSRKTKNDTIRYQYLVPFESWMKDARLDVQRDECGCGETALMNIEEIWQSDVGTCMDRLT